MEKITFECETITPMFLAGANGQTPELRAPSIKGALRFWWRAMQSENDPQLLLEKETNIFGGLGNKKSSGRRSSVIIKSRVINQTEFNPQTLNRDANPGIGYLLYSIFLNNRKGLSPLQFEVELKSNKREHLVDAAKAFWFLAMLGGLGTRSRRGAGNFYISSCNSDFEEGVLKTSFDSIPDFQDYWNQLFSIPSTTSKSRFCMLNASVIKIGNYPNKDALSCLNNIGKEFQTFRLRKQPDYINVKNFISKATTFKQVERTEFGLPLMFRYSSLNGPNNRANIEPNSSDYNRSASSLIISIIKINNNYYPILTNFNSELLPPKVNIKIKAGRNNGILTIPTSSLKTGFLNTLNTTTIL